MDTAERIADDIFIYKRSHPQSSYERFQKGVKYALTATAKRTDIERESSERVSKTQRVGAFFDEVDAHHVNSRSNDKAFSAGTEVGQRIKTLQTTNANVRSTIDFLLDGYIGQLPANEQPLELPSNSVLAPLLGSRYLNVLPLNDNVTTEELEGASIFDNTPAPSSSSSSSSGNRQYTDNVDDLSIEELLDHELIREYVNREALTRFRALADKRSLDVSEITDEDIQLFTDVFKSLQRGSFVGETRALVITFIIQCKLLSTEDTFYEVRSRMHVLFLTVALAEIIRRDSENESAFTHEAVRNYENFKKFWWRQQNIRWFLAKLQLSHQYYNDRLDVTSVSDRLLAFYSRFVKGLKQPLTTATLRERLRERHQPVILSEAPVQFTFAQSRAIATELGRENSETTLLNNLLSWVVEEDADLRLALHDSAVLRQALTETFERATLRSTMINRHVTEFVSRRYLLLYLANVEKYSKTRDFDDSVLQRYINYAKSLAASVPNAVAVVEDEELSDSSAYDTSDADESYAAYSDDTRSSDELPPPPAPLEDISPIVNKTASSSVTTRRPPAFPDLDAEPEPTYSLDSRPMRDILEQADRRSSAPTSSQPIVNDDDDGNLSEHLSGEDDDAYGNDESSSSSETQATDDAEEPLPPAAESMRKLSPPIYTRPPPPVPSVTFARQDSNELAPLSDEETEEYTAAHDVSTDEPLRPQVLPLPTGQRTHMLPRPTDERPSALPAVQTTPSPPLVLIEPRRSFQGQTVRTQASSSSSRVPDDDIVLVTPPTRQRQTLQPPSSGRQDSDVFLYPERVNPFDFSETTPARRSVLAPRRTLQPATGRRRREVVVSDDSDEVQDDNVNDDDEIVHLPTPGTRPPRRPIVIESSIGAGIQEDSALLPSRLESRIGNGIVVRRASHLDRRSGRIDDRHRNLQHFTAHRSTAIGAKLGFVSYDPERRRIITLDHVDQPTRHALLGAVKREHPHVDVVALPDNENRVGDNMNDTDDTHRPAVLTLDLTFDYTSFLAEAGETNERPYFLLVYPSGSYTSSPPAVVNIEHAGSVHKTLTFEVNRSRIPKRVSLNVDSYSHFRNDAGARVINQAGFASVRLGKLVRKKKVSLALRVPTSEEHVIKGRVAITYHSSSLLPEDGEYTKADEDRELSEIRMLIKQYIDGNRRFYDAHPPVSKAIAHTTVFKFRCRQNIVPGALFDNFKLPRSHEAYYLNALRNALQRRLPATRIDNVDEAWASIDSRTRVHVVMSMLTIYANACKYLKDSVDNNVRGGHWDVHNVEDIDSFDTMRHTDTGDCEDKTKEILLHAMELKYNSADFRAPVFDEVRAILEQFIFCSSLCAVSHASINKNDFVSKRELDGHMQAHECAVAVPNYIFFLALRRGNPNHALFNLYTEEEQALGRDEQLYVLEGTGDLSPEPRTSTEARDEVAIAYEEGMSEESDRNMTGQFFYDTSSDDSFYKIIVNLMTPEFYLRTGHIGFEFLVVGERGQRGVFFSDLLNINKNEGVRIVETPQLSPLTFNRSMRITEDNIPLLALEAPLAATEAMLNVARRLTLQTEPRRIPEHKHCYIIQCLFEHMTEEKIRSIVADVRARRLNVVCYVETVKTAYVSKEPYGRYTLIFY